MTDNTEAVEKLAEVVASTCGNYPAKDKDVHIAKAILAAIQASPMAYVKVNTCNVCGCSIVSEDGKSCTTPAL